MAFVSHAQEHVVPIEYENIQDFQKNISNQKKEVSFDRYGDLNNDGINDWVGVLNIPRDESPPFVQLVVLTGQPNGRFVKSVITTEVENYYEGSPSSWFDVSIRNASIYIETYGKTCCEFGSTRYQFKLFKDQWRLVGIKSTSGNTVSDGNPKNDFSKIEDINMLSGLTVVTSHRGGKKTERTHKRKRGVFLLDDFDFSSSYAQ
jgi:hypothetical protein